MHKHVQLYMVQFDFQYLFSTYVQISIIFLQMHSLLVIIVDKYSKDLNMARTSTTALFNKEKCLG